MSRFVSGIFWTVLFVGIVNGLILLFSGAFMWEYMKDDIEEGKNVFLGDEKKDSGQVENDTLKIEGITSNK